MQKIYVQQENETIRKILDETYDELMAAVKKRTPSAMSLIEDEEYSMLHDLLALLRLGHIRVSNGENERGLYMMIEIREDRTSFQD